MKLWCKSIAAGIMIGIGVIANCRASHPVLGAFLFSVALLSIVACQMSLFTGKVGFIERYTPGDLLTTLIANVAACSLVVFAGHVWQSTDAGETFQAAAALKFSKSFAAMAAAGFFCGVLMCIAVTAKQQLVTVLCIMTFILSGFEHSIADFPYLLACLTPESIFKYVVILLGNMAGAIVIHILLEQPFSREKQGVPED